VVLRTGRTRLGHTNLRLVWRSAPLPVLRTGCTRLGHANLRLVWRSAPLPVLRTGCTRLGHTNLRLVWRSAPLPVEHHPARWIRVLIQRGSSSVVEHHLAKVRVASSSLVSRSNLFG
jgi:hypothetical protein